MENQAKRLINWESRHGIVSACCKLVKVSRRSCFFVQACSGLVIAP